jgi:hypothetical protein
MMGLIRWSSIVTLSVFCFGGPSVEGVSGRVAGQAGGSNVPGAPNPAERVSVSGKLTDGDGNPLEDTQVLVFANYKVEPGTPAALGSEIGLAKADAEGSFTLLMGTGSESVVFATKPGYAMDYKILKAPADNIDVVLKSKGRKLGGTVVNAGGEPVPHALVGIAANSREVSDHLQVPWRIGLDSGQVMKVMADAEGKFLVDDLPALPLIVCTADAGESQTLAQHFLLSKKEASVDLGAGDELNFTAVIDEPVRLPDRTHEEQRNDDMRRMQHESLIKEVLKRRRDQGERPGE